MLLIKELMAMQETTVSRLAERVNLSQATVTDILNRLEGRGLIARARSRQDRRCVFIQVTPEARDLFHSAPQLYTDRFAASFASLQEWEQLQLVSSLNRVAGMMSGEPDRRGRTGAADLLAGDGNSRPVKPGKRQARGNP